MGKLDLGICLLLLSGCIGVLSQYDDDFGSPLPPRPVIPGAIPLGAAPARRPVFRAQPRQQQLPVEDDFDIATQRPRGRLLSRTGRLPLNQSPSPNYPPQSFSPSPPPILSRPSIANDPILPRPVIEEPEDNTEEEFPPLSLDRAIPSPTPPPNTPPPPPPSPPPPPPKPVRPVFRPERPVLSQSPSPELNYPATSRQQLRPTPAAIESQFSRNPSQYSNRGQQNLRVQQVQQQKPIYDKPEKPIRQKKPVAQVLRRYREDNPDGSITWGFENDDGSFKEETIGIDCVTRGKYGYIDPDGVRREYTYSSGIPCDKLEDQPQAASEGYIDYENNKYVLANGQSVDLDNMVKNRARKPVYRN